jgi:hypothetical protein
VAAVTVAVVVCMGALALEPAPAIAATVLEVDAGYAGSYRPGAPVPVRVRVSADRLLRAELEVRPSSHFGDSVKVGVPVEVPGGTVKEVVVVVPTDLGGGQTEVLAVLRHDGQEVARGSAGVSPTDDQELVGLLAGVLAGRQPPGVAPLAVDAGTARFSALGPAELAAAPASLAALDVVGAAPDDLATLDDGARAAVLTWVGEGGFLLVDTPVGEDITGLPAAWQPGSRGRARAGLGEVRATSGAMAAGNWPGLVEPTPVVGGQGGQFFGGFGLETALAADAGLSIPRLGWLVGFLAVYVLVAVPLTLTVLRRRGRGELGWVVLPLVALVFTAASYGAGREARGGTTAAHATVVHVTDAGALATTSVGIVSPDGGRVETGYPRRWAPAGRSAPMGGPPLRLAATIGSDGTSIGQDLDVGQFGVHRATGPVSLEGRLEVTASATGATTLEGTIRNTLPFALEEVAVLHDLSGEALGRLEPGEQREWTLEVVAGVEPFPGAGGRAWPDAAGFHRPPDPDSVVAFPLWNEFEGGAGSDALAPGTVVVAGWTREYEPPLDVPRSSLSGRTLVVGSAPVAAAAGAPLSPSVATSLVRGPFSTGGGFDDNGAAVFRLTPPSPIEGPPAFEAAGMVVSAPKVLAIETWSDGGWRQLSPGADPGQGDEPVPDPGEMGPGQIFGPTAEHPLPPEALSSGVVWVRARSTGFGFVDPHTLATSTLVTLGAAS